MTDTEYLLQDQQSCERTNVSDCVAELERFTAGKAEG